MEIATVIYGYVGRSFWVILSCGITHTSTSIVVIITEEKWVLGKWLIVYWVLIIATTVDKVHCFIEEWILWDRLALGYLDPNMV